MAKTKKSGHKKPVRGIKWCWLATEVKGGWRLKLEIGPYSFYPKPSKVFKTIEAVENFVNGFAVMPGGVVFIHLKDTKFPTK